MNFRDKIKDIRIKMGYSQEQLARELGVSFATINRWENGKSEPRQIARNAVRQFCVLHSIDIGEDW